MPEQIDHAAHYCTQACVTEHLLRCERCVMLSRDEVWFCRDGARLNQKFLKERLLTHA